MKQEVEFLTIYKAQIDESDRGPAITIGFFSSEIDARLFTTGKGWYGSNGWAHLEKAVKIDDKVYIISEPIDLDFNLAKEREKLKKIALSKLTEDEIKLLGI